MCRGTRSYSMGGVPLCCFWPGIWASVVEKPRCVGSEVCPVAGAKSVCVGNEKPKYDDILQEICGM